MAGWQEFNTSSPDLAAYGAGRLVGKVSYLATNRADGAPRVHPVVVHIGEGRLFVYMDPTSPKAHDLLRDGRYALHCSVEDADGGEGEFGMRGQAQVIEDISLRTRLFEMARANGFNPLERYILFELAVEEAFSAIYQGQDVTRKRWKAA
ncbi:MAG: pyridoxamine 5'-phosphate oxidase family protein [Anaerolineaceae bacterium]|nr:pyridoxamine 5'-phosphate oxidase family protein [Anaerolineaceae bacterium]